MKQRSDNLYNFGKVGKNQESSSKLDYSDSEDTSNSEGDNSTFLETPINKYKCNLTALRVAKGLTRSDLAGMIGKTNEFVCMIEHEKYTPILETKIKIAKALECDTSAIWVEVVEE